MVRAAIESRARARVRAVAGKPGAKQRSAGPQHETEPGGWCGHTNEPASGVIARIKREALRPARPASKRKKQAGGFRAALVAFRRCLRLLLLRETAGRDRLHCSMVSDGLGAVKGGQ